MSPYREYSDEQWKQSMLTMIDVSQLQSVAYNLYMSTIKVSAGVQHILLSENQSQPRSSLSFFFYDMIKKRFLQLCTVVEIIRGCNLVILGFQRILLSIDMNFKREILNILAYTRYMFIRKAVSKH